MARVIVTKEDIQRFNAMTEALAGTPNYNMFYVFHQYRNGNHWYDLGWGRVIEHRYGEYYLKRVKDNWYLMWEFADDVERWFLTTDVVMAYFGIKGEAV